MGYGGTHSNRDLPILVAGGGFKHRGHVDTSDRSGRHMPLCNLFFVTLMQRFGIERDRFNTSTGTFDLLAYDKITKYGPPPSSLYPHILT